jgi:hypothetical protein
VTVGRNTTCAFSNVWNVNLRSAAVVNRVKERVWIMYGSNCGGDLRLLDSHVCSRSAVARGGRVRFEAASGLRGRFETSSP